MEFTFSNYEYKWENNIRIGMIKPHQFQLYLENKWHIQGIRKYLNNKQRYVCIYIYIYTSFFVSFILYNWHVNLCVIRVVCFLEKIKNPQNFLIFKSNGHSQLISTECVFFLVSTHHHHPWRIIWLTIFINPM